MNIYLFIYCSTGTTVWSDKWRAYQRLTAVTGLGHATVNHSKMFVTAAGVHTNGIENLWMCCKDKMKRMRGTTDEHVASYLDEFMWHKTIGDRKVRFQRALELIRTYYPV